MQVLLNCFRQEKRVLSLFWIQLRRDRKLVPLQFPNTLLLGLYEDNGSFVLGSELNSTLSSKLDQVRKMILWMTLRSSIPSSSPSLLMRSQN